MKNRNIIIPIIGVVCLIFCIKLLRPSRATRENLDATVFVKDTDSGYKLIKEGSPFYIRGASGNSYFRELSEAGGNTIRLYDTTNINSLLESAKKYNLSVIVDIPLPKYRRYYDPFDYEENVSLVKGNLTRFITKYKNHPSILFWNLGNEINYPFVLRKNSFIKTFNELIQIVHEIDPNHPVATTISGTSRGQTLSIHLHSPELDLLGFNVFSNVKNLGPLLSKLSIITSPMPHYISEWGIDGPWDTEENLWGSYEEQTDIEKAKSVEHRYNTYIKKNANTLGSLVFYWGNKIEGTPTWFNIFDTEGRKSHMYYALQSVWKNNLKGAQLPPEILALNISQPTRGGDLVFRPNVVKKASINVCNITGSDLKIKWEIYKEDWANRGWIKMDSIYKDKSVFGSTLSDSIDFYTPGKEGSYRLFATLQDTKGNFSTANSPFFVLHIE